MRRLFAILPVLAIVATTGLSGQQTPAPSSPSFRSGVTLVLVDAVVRDRNGAVVKGLTADHFEVFEDGVRQQILSFAYEEVTPTAPPIGNARALTASVSQTVTAPPQPPATGSSQRSEPATLPTSEASTGPLTSDQA